MMTWGGAIKELRHFGRLYPRRSRKRLCRFLFHPLQQNPKVVPKDFEDSEVLLSLKND
jgi:hypothetical protein